MSTRQWPDHITSEDIRYDPSGVFEGGFVLRDVDHGIPVFGSVSAEIFNYPGQTEDIAKALCHRWNCHQDLLEALKGMREEWAKFTRYGSPMAVSANEAVQAMEAAIAKAESLI